MSAGSTRGDAAPLMGVVLAAGKGSRMGLLGEHYPKPILPVGGKPHIACQLEAMAGVGIREAVVVVGHRGEQVREALGSRCQGIDLRYAEQVEPLGIAHALGRLAGLVDQSFLLFLGDIYFAQPDLEDMARRLASPRGVGGVVAVKDEPDLAAMRRNFEVTLDGSDGNDRIQRVVEKPFRPKGTLKGVGLYGFQPEFFDAVRRTPRSALRDEYELTDAIQIFIDRGARVEASRAVVTDINLSTPADLLAVNLALLAGGESRVHPGAAVAPDAQLTRCEVLPGASVGAGAQLEGCLVLEGAQVSPGSRHSQAVIAPAGIVPA